MYFQFEINKPKGTCPSCGYYGKFRFIENVKTGERYPPIYGRCDRENSCGYISLPTNKIETEARTAKIVSHKEVKASLDKYYLNHFFEFLEGVVGKETAASIFNRYEVGSGKGKKTVFWYKDEQGFHRNAKVYLYNKDGKRDKKYSPRYMYIQKKGYIIPIYGSHLLPAAKQAGIEKIAVVESEKTVLLTSILDKKVLWLASGGANMLTEERCKKLAYYSKVLENAPIHLFADADMAGRKGFITAFERLKKLSAPVIYHDLYPNRDDGWDLADEILGSNVFTHVSER